VSDAPFFPPPKKKDAYREPAPKPAASLDLLPQPERKPIVVARAIEEDAPLTREEKAGELVDAARTERGFWERHSFWANYPRATGAILTVVGGILSVPLFGGFVTRGSSVGLFLLMTGLWSLVAGYPVERDGRFPRWWALGLFAAWAIGGVVLLVAMVAR
jgi:hypothetical protein